MKATIFLFVLAVAYAKPLDKFLEYARKHPNNDPFPNPEYNPDLLEGDIVVGSEEEAASLNKASPLNATPNRDKRWVLGVLPYSISSTEYTAAQVETIEKGIRDLEEKTKVNGEFCVQLIPRTTEQDYVFIDRSNGCSSPLGRVGGGRRQTLSLANGCVQHGIVMHEFLHALGFVHEQKRADRDDYVAINYDNIPTNLHSQFNKLVEGVQVDHLGTAYDYGSVMHYGPYAFAQDRNIPTIVPHDPDATIGQRTHVSALDIERVQIFYDCITPAESKYFKHLG